MRERKRCLVLGGPVRTLWRLIWDTVKVCLRYRVTGLAAEAGFFALLSLPPLLLGLIGSIGYVDTLVGHEDVTEVRDRIVELASTLLTTRSVESVITPTLDEVLQGGRIDVASIAFVLSLWSGSRVVNVYVDTITIMYGLSGHRGIVRTRALSFTLYLLSLIVGTVLIPLVIAGPQVVGSVLPDQVDWILRLYWPVVSLLSVAFLATLYHVAVPVRTPWRRDLPGAVLALTIWVVGSYGLRIFIGASVGGTSIYGPLATPIVVLIWLYMLALAVLIGAAFNVVIEDLWPTPGGAVQRERRRVITGDERRPV